MQTLTVTRTPSVSKSDQRVRLKPNHRISMNSATTCPPSSAIKPSPSVAQRPQGLTSLVTLPIIDIFIIALSDEPVLEFGVKIVHTVKPVKVETADASINAPRTARDYLRHGRCCYSSRVYQ